MANNAFYVLGLSTRANRWDVEHAEAELLDAIARGRPGATTYDTPVGARTRDAAAVRAAAEALADPDRRIDHELWAALPGTGQYAREALTQGWSAADAAFGWRVR